MRVINSKILLFPDKYLLRGTFVLVAISLMVPGIFGIAPPRWFDNSAATEYRVSAAKTGQSPVVIIQTAKCLRLMLMSQNK